KVIWASPGRASGAERAHPATHRARPERDVVNGVQRADPQPIDPLALPRLERRLDEGGVVGPAVPPPEASAVEAYVPPGGHDPHPAPQILQDRYRHGVLTRHIPPPL